MSIEKYYELYKQFLDNSISKDDYEELMDWVSDEKNDKIFRGYMDRVLTEMNIITDKDIYTESVRFRGSKKEVKRSVFNRALLSKVASVLLFISLSCALLFYSNSDKQVYKTKFAETKEIILDDGSEVIINANSKLIWYKSWRKNEKRTVRLKGEAYFNVRHMKDDISFNVVTQDLTISVLGTTFNVNSRNNKTDVILETGKIKLDLNRPKDRQFEMNPGDRVNFSAANNTLEKSYHSLNQKSISWIKGVLRFEDVSMLEVFQKIEELYGKVLISDDKNILTRRVFIDIPYENWNIVKEALEIAFDIRITEANKKLYISNKLN